MGKAGYPAQQSLEQALRKIRHNSTMSQWADVSRRVGGLDVIPTVRHEEYFAVIAEIEACMASENTITIAYRKPKEEAAGQREVDPYGLIHWRERWYMVGYCHLRGEVRIFRVDRIQTCTATKQAFARPPGFSASSFFTSRQIYEVSADDAVTHLLLEGDNDAMEDLANHWFLGPRLVEKRLREASFLVENRALASYLPHILLAYGRSVSILEPLDLIEWTAALARELTDYYDSQLP